MVSKATKEERLDLRLSGKHKALIEQAATLSGQPVTTFVVSTLVEHAQDVLRRHETTTLSERDRRRFMKILDETEPTVELRRAAERFRARRV